MEILFKRATIDHAKTLYEWRNDPFTRNNSHNSEELKWIDHLKWFTNSLQNPEREIFLALKSTPLPANLVAMVRRDRNKCDPDSWTLSWVVSPSVRRQGVGKILLNQFVTTYPAHYFADIKKENVASNKMAENAGFKLFEKFPDYHRWFFSPSFKQT